MKNKTIVVAALLTTSALAGCSTTLPRDVAERVDGKLAYAYVHHVSGTSVGLNFFQDRGEFIGGKAVVPAETQVKAGAILKVRLTKGMPGRPVDFVQVAAHEPTATCQWVGSHGGFGAGGVVCDGWDYKVDLPLKGVSLLGNAY